MMVYSQFFFLLEFFRFATSLLVLLQTHAFAAHKFIAVVKAVDLGGPGGGRTCAGHIHA